MHARHAVTGRPCPGALFNQLLLLLMGRHAPRRSPINISGIILRVQLRLAIFCYYWNVITRVIVISLRVRLIVFRIIVIVVVIPLVIVQVIVVFGLGLAPGEVVAVFLRSVRTDVARRP